MPCVCVCVRAQSDSPRNATRAHNRLTQRARSANESVCVRLNCRRVCTVVRPLFKAVCCAQCSVISSSSHRRPSVCTNSTAAQQHRQVNPFDAHASACVRLCLCRENICPFSLVTRRASLRLRVLHILHIQINTHRTLAADTTKAAQNKNISHCICV